MTVAGVFENRLPYLYHPPEAISERRREKNSLFITLCRYAVNYIGSFILE